MKKLQLFVIILCNFLFIATASSAPPPSFKMAFWSSQKKGANVFNQKITSDLIKQAKTYGIAFIRLAPDKFLSQKKDFLMGNADDYKKLIPEDVKNLKEILDLCAKEKLPVVLSFLSLPGSRWKQNNRNQNDLRLWKDKAYQDQAIKFWKDVALTFKDHPAVVGYNILNEPYLERAWDRNGELYLINQKEIQKVLHSFYAQVAAAIRTVDIHTPIILDCSSYGDPRCFKNMIPLKDKNVLYSFHMYEPYAYTNYKSNKGKYIYPGKIPDAGTNEASFWNIKKLKSFLNPIAYFQQKYNIPNNHILVGEFGGHRLTKGLECYFSDLVSLFNEHGWHWAVYAFREDTWDGMDYELGNKKLPGSYWTALEKGQEPLKPYQPDNLLFNVLKKEWKNEP